MSKCRTASEISDYMSLGSFDRAKTLLEKHNGEIDILHNDGIYFTYAIAKNNAEMLDTLIQYFEKAKLIDDRETISSKAIRYKLRQVIREAIEESGDLPEIQKTLNKYDYLFLCGSEGDSEQDLSGFEEIETASDALGCSSDSDINFTS